MNIEGFDADSLNSELGLSNSGTIDVDSAETQTLRVNEDDRQQFQSLAEQQPTGITVSGQETTPTIPEYLAPFIPAKPTEAPAAPAAINWQQRYTDTFGTDAATLESYDQDVFEREAVRRNVYDNHLANNPQLAGLRAAIDGSQPDLKIVQDAVRGRLVAAGFESDTSYQNELVAYVNDGELTDKGKALLTTVKQNATTQIGQIEQQATQAAEQAEGRLTAYNTAITNLSTTFKPFGLELPEAQLADMTAAIRSGKVDSWLDTHTSAEDAAEKQFWLAVISDPAWRGEMARLLDGRGFNHGRNRRTASQFN